MCTCCITCWPHQFCWIEHSRHSRAVVGYVTSWANSCLSVSWGLSHSHSSVTAEKHLGHAAAASRLWPLHPTSAVLSPPLFFFLSLCLLSPHLAFCPPARPVGRPFWWHLTQVDRFPTACYPELITLKYSSSAAQGFADVHMICSVFFSSTSSPTQQLLIQFI